MENKIYTIIPDCDDQNRGDQALVWETVRIARQAGYDGDFYMMSDSSKSDQSDKVGIKSFAPVLKHPSRFFKKNNNIRYGPAIKLKWGFVAIFDLISSACILNPVIRKTIKPLLNKTTEESLDVMNSSDAVFVKGGGFIHAYGDITAFYYMYMALYHIMLSLSMKKSVYILPNSFGPLRGLFVKKLAKSVLSKCRTVTARESISAEVLLNELDIKASVYPDLAFYLKKDSENDIKTKLIKAGIPIGTSKCVAMTVRPYRFPNSEDPAKSYEQYKKSIVDFISWLNKNDYFPVLIEHTYNTNEHERDITCINEVVKNLRDVKYYVFSDLSLNCAEMKNLYSCFDYTVGTRFHSVIFSLSEGVPSVAIAYGGNKGNGIMRDMNLSDYVINIEELTGGGLIEKFQLLTSKNNEVKSIINLYMEGTSDLREELIKELKTGEISGVKK
jgi:colanic acid/amylovoran biosynthesis protein